MPDRGLERAPGNRAGRPLSSFDNAYEGTPTWDIGRPQGVVARLVASGSVTGAVLDAGCGTGEHALMLARLGHRVVGVDISPLAVEKARAKAVARGVEVSFIVGDALELDALVPAQAGGVFDTALDVGLFHVLQPDDRRWYARSLAAVVRPGGRALVTCWSASNPFGYGPQRITRSMLRRSFVAADGWRIEAIEPEELETRLPVGRVDAWLATIRRR